MSEKYDVVESIPINDMSDTVRLPVGLEVDGVRYRKVVLDEMTGIDDHNIASKKAGNNGAKAMTLLLCRCVQKIEGYLNRKENPEKLFDRSFARKLTIVDREFLLTRIYILSGDDKAMLAGQCPRCNEPWEEDIFLSELPVVEWPEDKPLEVEFELPRGFVRDGKVHKKGVVRFPTGKEQELMAELKNPAQIFDSLFASCLKQLGDLTSFDQEMMKRMRSTDRRYLMQHLQSAFPGVRQWKEVRCRCGRDFSADVDLTSFFDGGRRTAS